MIEAEKASTVSHPNVKDISGQRFGKWIVLNRAAQNGRGRNARWTCRCDCGVEFVVLGAHLRTGRSGCCRKCAGVKLSKAKKVHGECCRSGTTRTYSCWVNMRSRAESNKTLEARKYAKRDITICDRWSSFQSFVKDMGHCPSPKHSIDRKNNELGYSPENCRWATNTEQQRNKSSNRIVVFRGESICVSEFAERIGISYEWAARRTREGWSADRIAAHYVK